MLIVAIDRDNNFTNDLGIMLKDHLMDIEYRSFVSADDCLRFVRDNNVSLVFLDKDIGNAPYDMRFAHQQLRKLERHIDIILVGNDNRLDENTAIWSIQNRCSDYICKPLTIEKLLSSLQNIWFNPIPQLFEDTINT